MRKMHIVEVWDVKELTARNGRPFWACTGLCGGKKLSFVCFEFVSSGDIVGVTYNKKGEKFISEVFQVNASVCVDIADRDVRLPR